MQSAESVQSFRVTQANISRMKPTGAMTIKVNSRADAQLNRSSDHMPPLALRTLTELPVDSRNVSFLSETHSQDNSMGYLNQRRERSGMHRVVIPIRNRTPSRHAGQIWATGILIGTRNTRTKIARPDRE